MRDNAIGTVLARRAGRRKLGVNVDELTPEMRDLIFELLKAVADLTEQVDDLKQEVAELRVQDVEIF